MPRLRHEIAPWLARHRSRGIRVVASAVLVRLRFRRALAKLPLDRALRVPPSGDLGTPIGWGDAVTGVRIVDALGGWLAGGTCLDRAVGRAHALRGLGWHGRLVIGARLNDAAAPCHAWVEVAGEVLLDPSAGHYRELYSNG